MCLLLFAGALLFLGVSPYDTPEVVDGGLNLPVLSTSEIFGCPEWTQCVSRSKRPYGAQMCSTIGAEKGCSWDGSSCCCGQGYWFSRTRHECVPYNETSERGGVCSAWGTCVSRAKKPYGQIDATGVARPTNATGAMDPAAAVLDITFPGHSTSV